MYKCKEEFDDVQGKLGRIESVLKNFEVRMQTIEQRIESFETSVMAIQTDESDSKIKNARLRTSITSREVKSSHKDDYTSAKESDLGKTTTSTAALNANDKDSIFKNGTSVQQKERTSSTADSDGTSDSSAIGAVGGDPKEGSVLPNTQTGESSGHLDEETIRINKLNEKNSEKMQPHTSRQQESGEVKVQVIEQRVAKSHDDENYWRYLAVKEVEKGKETLKDLEGVHSIVCLDISESMVKGDAWKEAKSFVLDYFNGLEEVATRYGIADEHVALVTFGHETKVQKRLTNKFNELRDTLESLQLGGPSPLYGGMALALAAAGSSHHIVHMVNVVQVFTKIIVITDGQLTDQKMFAGPDIPGIDVDRGQSKVLQLIEEYKSNHIDIYVVPVGQADREFLNLMTNVGEASMLDYKSGRQLSRRTYLSTKVHDPLGIDVLGLLEKLTGIRDESLDLSAEDKKMMDDIKEKAKKSILSPFGVNKYAERKDANFPPIGSRVRRGPDWKWKEQDSYGPGTVIGHSENSDQVWVEWDENEHQNVYRYGNQGYDVLIVDQPRELKRGQEIAVGCVVRPGKDRNVHKSVDRGVVVKIDRDDKTATIRWSNGEISDCTYGRMDKQEIVVCSGFQPFETEGHVLGSTFEEKPVQIVEIKTKNKNKNKNVN